RRHARRYLHDASVALAAAGPKQKGPGDRRLSPSVATLEAEAYLRAFCTDTNVPFRLVPTFFTTVIMATEMPAAMRPYSMAVAPDWSFTKRCNRLFLVAPCSSCYCPSAT